MTRLKRNIKLRDCNPIIFKFGTRVAIATDGPPEMIELFVREVRRETHTFIDWHYAGGRAQILCLGFPWTLRRVARAMGLKQLRREAPCISVYIPLYAPD